MSSKLRNKNQRTTTRAYGLDKQDPLDLETLNSEPKGKSKSKETRLQERHQEREKLLQQHRLHQQETLKRQRERDNVQKGLLTAEHRGTNQDTRDEQPAEVYSEPEAIPDVLQENQQPRSEADVHPVIESDVHNQQSLDHNDESHGALGDSISQKVKSNHQRCTTCCGRDQYTLKNANAEKEDLKQKRAPCGCRGVEKGQIHKREILSSNSSEIGATGYNELPKSQSSFHQHQNSNDENETRLRGGCGGGGGARNSACCPCGGCGGAACATNTRWDSRPPVGCCGGNQSSGLPCRCKCRSCSSPSPPCGSCGGKNCGRWNSCAGSGGGQCCFPRNTKRHNGPDCCGGGSGGCGSFGGCC